MLEQAYAVWRTRPEEMDYEFIQTEMERAAPGLAETAWGHKYFSLLYPDILAPFHSTTHQQFHLIKLLIQPPREILYAGGRISLEQADDETSLPGFLFDMNRFFQALLARFLGDNLTGYELHEEHALRQMFRYSPGANPRNRPAPTPRPDFAIGRAGRIVALLDAKYRDLWERSLPREMLYQLALYALSQPPGERGSSEAAILYPTVASSAQDARIEVRDPVLGQVRAFVILRPVHLAELEAAIAGSEAKRAALARALVFGAEAAGR